VAECYPDIAWYPDGSVFVSNNENSHSNIFVETLSDAGIFQVVKEPTFVKANGSSTSTLHLILTEHQDRILEIEYDSPLGTSSQGHKTITFEYELSENNSFSKKFSSQQFNYRRGDYTTIGNKMSEVNWQSLLSNKNVDEAYQSVVNEYNSL
jgi:hypothetical protein